MKRVKVMLSAILVLGVVAGALAFKAKTPNVCIYTRDLADGPAVTTCPSITVGIKNTTTTIADDKYATTFLQPAEGCPATTTCGQFLITVNE